MDRIRRWFQLDGDTARERIVGNPLQLFVLVITVWVGTVVAFFTFSSFMGERWATLVILLGAVAVGLHLRDLLIPPRTDLD